MLLQLRAFHSVFPIMSALEDCREGLVGTYLQMLCTALHLNYLLSFLAMNRSCTHDTTRRSRILSAEAL